jgi:hypothetical protein
MRSSKGTARFLLIAFVILAILAYFSAKDADKEQAESSHKQAVKAVVRPVNND